MGALVNQVKTKAMCWIRAKRSSEDRLPFHNLVLVLLLQLLVSSAYSLLAPSLYKFITTPTTRPDELRCSENGTRFWPGLGGSDTDYALVLVSYPLFEVATTPLAGALLHRLPFTISIISFMMLYITGGIVYGLARSVWMAFVGFGLIGAGSSIGPMTIHTYMGEVGTLMDDIRKKQGKRPIKPAIYVCFSFLLNGGYLLPLTIASIVAQFDVNPYHWPGWMQAAITAVYAVVTFFLFVETRSLSQARPSCKSVSSSCLAGLKLESQLQTTCKNLSSYVFLCGCGVLGGMMYTIVFFIVAPVLSDQFGFTVEYTSHYLIGISSAFLISSILQLAAKCVRVDNRIILGLGIFFALAGSLLFGDWQAVHSDHCFSSFTRNSTLNVLLDEDISGDDGTQQLCVEGSSTNSSLVQELVESCESLGSSGQDCFWNRQSRVTDSYCYSCLGVCLSLQRSHNIYQLSIGAVLLCFSATFLFVYSSAIVSGITSVKSQGKVISFIIGSGSLTRAVTPFFFIRSYELTGRHTYSAMAATAGYALLLLLSLATLYKNLAPRDPSSVINATSNLSPDAVDQDPTGVSELADVAGIPEDTSEVKELSITL